MTDIQFFDNGEFELRMTMVGDSYRIAAPSLARDLGFKDAHDLVRGLPEAEKGTELVRTPGGDQRVLYVTEAGFYRVLGQRQVARIKDRNVRDKVARFQNWVYGDVLPTIRRTGGYQPAKPAEAIEAAQVDTFAPVTWTWDEARVVIRQRYGVNAPVIHLRRTLRTAGVLRQTGEPKTRYEHWFWFTGTAWEILPHYVPALLRKYEDTIRALRGHQQGRLNLAGDELPFDGADVIELRQGGA